MFWPDSLHIIILLYRLDETLHGAYEHTTHKMAPPRCLWIPHIYTKLPTVCYTKYSLEGEREELLLPTLEAGDTSALTLSPPLLALSLPIEKESEKTREEVKEVGGTMWIELITHLIKQC